jgi:hypothetical protein
MKPVPGAALAAVLALLIAACAAGSGDGATAAGSPRGDAAAAMSPARVISTEGFSFLPPQGPGWTEAMEGDRVVYTKATDPGEVSFYAGAVDGKLVAALASSDALLAFVREQKDQWGQDGRYVVTRADFAIDPAVATCVVYALSAQDRGAKNQGAHEHLVLESHGRYCVHPDAPTSFVDLFYSVRYVPAYSPRALQAEGQALLDSLRVERRRSDGLADL